MTRMNRHGWVRAASLVVVAGSLQTSAVAQGVVTTMPSRQVLDEASQGTCDGVSVIVQRCASKPADAAAPDSKAAPDPLVRSRAATKAAFDRRDSRARDAALKGGAVPSNTPVGDAQRLGGVTVTGRQADPPPSVEEVLQRALAPTPTSPDGTVSHYGADGVRYDCIAKCIGPACCATVRSMPNPARDSISIGR